MLFRSAGDDGPVVNGLLVAAIKEAVAANVAAAVTQAGLRPVHVDLVPFALTRAMAPAGTENSLSVLIGVGANTTNVVVVQGRVPHFVRIIAGGGDDITRAISLRLQINFDQAEALKRSLGVGSASVSPEQRSAVDAIHDVVGEQLVSIRNTLSYYVSSKRRAPFDRIIISGGGTHLSGYASALSETTGYPVEQASTLRGAQLSRELQSTATPEQHDEMAIAFGLALGTSA